MSHFTIQYLEGNWRFLLDETDVTDQIAGLDLRAVGESREPEVILRLKPGATIDIHGLDVRANVRFSADDE